MKKLISFFGVALALLLFLTPALPQSSPKKYLSAAGTNSTLVWGGRALLRTILPINTTTTMYYLKLYNTATPPTCGSGTPSMVIPIPFGSGNAGGGVALPSVDGLIFQQGLGFCLTGGIADNDTTPAAAGVVINLGVSSQ